MQQFENIKKIGIISDTHIPIRAKQVPKKVFEIFKDVDLILHAGDLVEPSVIEELKQIAPVVAVKGNMDKFQNSLQEKEIIQINNKFKIGLFHGEGEGDTLNERISNYFENVDCIVFGHSHQSINETKNNVLLFNPGSACDTVFTNVNSIGILHIDDQIRGEIIQI